jgi:hypothetical protein
MQSHIDLDPDVANKLRALAEAKGVTVEELLREFVADAPVALPGTALPGPDEFEADLEAFAEGTENLESPYNGSYSREDIYFDHD